MVKQNSSGQDYTNATDGFTIGGGITERILTVTGGNPTITASGTNVYTMPSGTDTLVGRASTDVLTNKDSSSSTNLMPSTTLGYAQITANATTTSTTNTQVTGLTITVTVPSGGRRVRLTVWTAQLSASVASNLSLVIYEGVVPSGTQLSLAQNISVAAMCMASAIVTPSAGSHTYNAGFSLSSAGTLTIAANTAWPAYILAELI